MGYKDAQKYLYSNPPAAVVKEEQKEWDIVEIYRPSDNSLHLKNKYDINQIMFVHAVKEFSPFTVKRLSDNESFSIGDKVEYGAISLEIASKMKIKETIISRFEIKSQDIWAYGENFFIAPLSHLKHPQPTEQKKVLFTTLDGVPVFEDSQDSIFYIDMYDDRWEPTEILACNFWTKESDLGTRDKAIQQLKKGFTPQQKWFSTEEKATEYVLYNKPVLSLNDLLDVWDADQSDVLPKSREYYANSPMFKNFLKKAKQKIEP